MEEPRGTGSSARWTRSVRPTGRLRRLRAAARSARPLGLAGLAATLAVLALEPAMDRPEEPAPPASAAGLAATIERLGDLCRRHHAFTDRVGAELPGGPLGPRDLSSLEPHALRGLPAGARVYPTLEGGHGSGFDLDGDGHLETTGRGNHLVLPRQDPETARALDRLLDAERGPLPHGDGSGPRDWERSGRVRFSPGSGTLAVFLADLD